MRFRVGQCAVTRYYDPVGQYWVDVIDHRHLQQRLNDIRDAVESEPQRRIIILRPEKVIDCGTRPIRRSRRAKRSRQSRW